MRIIKTASAIYEDTRNHIIEELKLADKKNMGDEYLLNVIAAANSLLSQSLDNDLVKLSEKIRSLLQFYTLAYGDPNYSKGLTKKYNSDK